MFIKFREKFPKINSALVRVFSRENFLALMIALILIAIYISTAADAPAWLYQGF